MAIPSSFLTGLTLPNLIAESESTAIERPATPNAAILSTNVSCKEVIMKTAILFAGQGAQYVGMGKDFYEEYEECREVYDNANVDFSLQNLCFEGPKEMLDNTAFAQSCKADGRVW